jgi:hypothetical protein
MSWDDYEAGRQNPNQLPGPGPTNWDFQQGQFDAYKELQDKLFKPAAGMPASPAATAQQPAASGGPPFRGLPKSMIAAVVLPLLLGPLGLFYGTWRGAFLVIGCLLAFTMLTGSTDNPAVVGPLLVGSYVVSIIWSIVAVATYNRNR